MTTHRDCASCYSMYLHVDTEPCGTCWKKSEWKPATKEELERRLRHIAKILEEVKE